MTVNPDDFTNFFDKVLAYLSVFGWTNDPKEHHKLDLGRALARASCDVPFEHAWEMWHEVLNANLKELFPGRGTRVDAFNYHPDTNYEDVIFLLDMCALEIDL
jgi:hypothetical protein